MPPEWIVETSPNWRTVSCPQCGGGLRTVIDASFSLYDNEAVKSVECGPCMLVLDAVTVEIVWCYRGHRRTTLVSYSEVKR